MTTHSNSSAEAQVKNDSAASSDAATENQSSASRRNFIKGSSLLLAGGAMANTLPVARAAHALDPTQSRSA